MIRKLAIALSLLGACFAGFVHALGLGEVTVKSALNQPLNAEIQLVNTAGLTINEILPGLATREEFQKANVDRVYFLSDLRFEVITSSQGKASIILTSKKPVREPFLNFIVELIWPSGRLLREYALLIDPPLFSDQPIAKTSSNTNTDKVASGDVLNISSNTSGSASSRSILAPTTKIETGTYGATNSNDTLWDIAIKARPNRSVSPQQVMLAIQDLNPDAFIDDNINKLKAGQVLRLPSVEQIKQRSQHQSIINVIAQNEALLGKRTASVVQGSKAKDSSLSTPNKKSKQTISKSSGDELKLVVSDDGTSVPSNSANSGQSNQSGSGSANDLTITLEKLDKASIENKELNSRVTDLEEQLSMLQRLLTLKNDQLASIQTQMRSNELDKLKAQNDSEDGLAPLVAINSETDSAKDNELVEGTVPSLEEKVAVSLDASSDGNADKLDSTVESVPGDAVKDAAKNQDQSTANLNTDSNKQKPSSQNIIQMIINSPLYLGISLVCVLLLVIFLWVVSRNNAKREEEFQAQNTSNDDEFNESAFDADSENENDSAYEDNELENENSYDSSDELNDYQSESEGETQDILAEVNAYISYGRLDQASSILEKAISHDPVRTDYRLKLLSIYKDLGDRQAFERQFSELEAIQDESAIKAAEKIREEILEEEALTFDTEDTELELDRDADNAEDEPVSSSDDSELDEELKAFDFDSVGLEDESEDEDQKLELELDLSSELDLDSLEANDDVSEDSLEVDDVLTLDSSESDLDESIEELSIDDFDDSILDVELEDLDLNAELDQETEIALPNDIENQEPEISSVEEELVVSDDILEEAAQAFEEETVELGDELTDSDEFDFLNGTDEASTKLDLARAYIDMGDIEGAKDILLEVTKEGSDAQQAEAKELIESLD